MCRSRDRRDRRVPISAHLPRTVELTSANSNVHSGDSMRGEKTRPCECPWSASGTNRPCEGGQSMSALPGHSDINLFRYCQGVIDLDAKIPDRAFDLGMPQQELDGPEISCPSIDQGGFCS